MVLYMSELDSPKYKIHLLGGFSKNAQGSIDM